MPEPSDMIQAQLRVTSLKIVPFEYKDSAGLPVMGETVQAKAAGYWYEDGNTYPISIHYSTPPGHSAIPPAFGDMIDITIKRHDYEVAAEG